MTLKITTPATATNLAGFERAIRHLGLDSSVANDCEAVKDLIEYASAAARSFTGRIFARQTYTETVSGTASTLLRLSEMPIVSITSIVRDTSPVTDFSIEDAEAGMLRRDAGWAWDVGARSLLGGTRFLPGRELAKYTVIYVAGWILPEETGRDLPQDIEYAVLETVRAWFRSAKDRTQVAPVTRRTVDGLTVVRQQVAPTQPDALDLPPQVTAILRRFRVLDGLLV